MAPTRKKLLEEALQLPEEERAGLVAELLESFASPAPGESRSDEEWIAEVERRAREAIAGAPSISWEEAQKEMRKRLPSK